MATQSHHYKVCLHAKQLGHAWINALDCLQQFQHAGGLKAADVGQSVKRLVTVHVGTL